MPVLNLSGVYPDDLYRLNAVMLFPKDEKLRAYSYQRQKAGLQGDGNYGSDPELPDRARVRKQGAKSAVNGYFAGEVMYFLYQLSVSKVEEASLSKAMRLARFNLQGSLNNQENNRVLTISERSAYKHWAAYKSVAHFWAVIAFCQYSSEISASEIYKENSFEKLLGLSLVFQNFATTFSSPRLRGSAGMPLNKDSLWSLPVDISPIQIPNVTMPDLFFKKAKKTDL